MSRLPGPYIALASQVAGEITDVADCSWPRDSSAVWRLTCASGRYWYLKRHSSGRFHAREVAALQGWAQALGPGRVPELAAADPEQLIMVVSAVPGRRSSGPGSARRRSARCTAGWPAARPPARKPANAGGRC